MVNIVGNIKVVPNLVPNLAPIQEHAVDLARVTAFVLLGGGGAGDSFATAPPSYLYYLLLPTRIHKPFSGPLLLIQVPYGTQ